MGGDDLNSIHIRMDGVNSRCCDGRIGGDDCNGFHVGMDKDDFDGCGCSVGSSDFSERGEGVGGIRSDSGMSGEKVVM